MTIGFGAKKVFSKNFVSKLFLSFAFFVLSAHARYDIARNDFEATNFVGPILLDKEKLADWNSADATTPEGIELLEHQEKRLFATDIDLSADFPELKPRYSVPDLLYPVSFSKKDDQLVYGSEKNSMGLFLIPVGKGEAIYRIPDEARTKFNLVDAQGNPITGTQRTVTAEEWSLNAQKAAEEVRSKAPLLTLASFKEVRSEVEKELKVEASLPETATEFPNKDLFNQISTQLELEIERSAPANGFDEFFVVGKIESEGQVAQRGIYEDVVASLKLKDRVSEESVDVVIAEIRKQYESSGQPLSSEQNTLFVEVSEFFKSYVEKTQNTSPSTEIDVTKMTEAVQNFCKNKFPSEGDDQNNCSSYAYDFTWGLQAYLPKQYANRLKNTYSYSLSNKRFNENDFWEKVWQKQQQVEEPNPNELGVKIVDRLLRQVSYPSAGVEDSRNIYAIVGHTSAHEAIYKTLKDLTGTKVQTSIHHVSAYLGANGYTRRGFLEGGEPNNLYTVTLKGVDQEALNLNAKIWAKLYYENPESYQFSNEYEFDEFENTTVRRVFDFARAWLDTSWQNKVLNASYLQYAQDLNLPLTDDAKKEIASRPYYQWLQKDKVFGLYCFEGVTNQLNIALNVPLTKKYLRKIFGAETGELLFAKANERWLTILKAEGIPEDVLPQYNLEVLASVLNKMKPLWEMKGMLTNAAQFNESNPLSPDRDEHGRAIRKEANRIVPYVLNPLHEEEINTVGLSLAWTPQTTADILADLIEIYTPFHKTAAPISTGIILGFQKEHGRRTGIAKEMYMGFALPIIAKMYEMEASLFMSKNPQNTAAAKAVYLAKSEKFLLGLLSKPVTDDEGTVTVPAAADVAKVFSFLWNGTPQITGVKASIESANALSQEKVLTTFQEITTGMSASEIASNQLKLKSDAAKLAAWRDFKAVAKAILKKANQIPVAIPDSVLAHAQDKKYVKFYSRPGLLQSMALGVWPTNPHVLVRGVGTIIDESATKLKAAGVDLATYDFAQENFVQLQTQMAEEFRASEVTDFALSTYKETLYKPSVIGQSVAGSDKFVVDADSSDVSRRVLETLTNKAKK